MKASIRYNDDRIAGTESQFKRWHINANTTSCMHLLHHTLALLRKFYASSSSSSPSLSYYHSFIILRFLHYPSYLAASVIIPQPLPSHLILHSIPLRFLIHSPSLHAFLFHFISSQSVQLPSGPILIIIHLLFLVHFLLLNTRSSFQPTLYPPPPSNLTQSFSSSQSVLFL